MTDTGSSQRYFKKPNFLVTWFRRLSAIGLLIVACLWLDRIKDRWYVFDPAFLHELANSAITASPNHTAGMISHIITNLTETYPSSVVRLNAGQSQAEWFFNNAGGAMGAVYIIHASITEYILIFGTPLGTEGHTGLHTADDYFNILIGEEWAFAPGQFEMERYTPGMVHFMPRGVKKQYKMHEGCWALEYARGWIPLMTPFGLADGLTSTLDFSTIYRTMRINSQRDGW